LNAAGICFSGHVQDNLVYIKELQAMAAKVDPDKCNACKSCVDACPNQSITVPDDKAVVNEAECIDCGACVDACPSTAITMGD
jgi:ferredoxin